MIEDYFYYYPAKRAEYEEKISARKEQVAQRTKNETEIVRLKRAIPSNENRVKRMEEEVEQLRKKVFGKKKALAQAAEIEQTIRQTKEYIAEMNAKLNTLEQQVCSFVDDEVFFHQLVEEMDCFIAWRWVDENENTLPPINGNPPVKPVNESKKVFETQREYMDCLFEILQSAQKALNTSEILEHFNERNVECSFTKAIWLLKAMRGNGTVKAETIDGKCFYLLV